MFRSIKIVYKSSQRSTFPSVSSQLSKQVLSQQERRKRRQAKQLFDVLSFHHPNSNIEMLASGKLTRVQMQDNLQNSSLIFSIGDEPFYLKVASSILSSSSCILGINSKLNSDHSLLLPVKLSNAKEKDLKQFEEAVKKVSMREHRIINRMRIQSRVLKSDGSYYDLPLSKYSFYLFLINLALKEVLVMEKEHNRCLRYQTNMQDLRGQWHGSNTLKSSGFVVGTGSGSQGIIKDMRMVSLDTFERIASHLGIELDRASLDQKLDFLEKVNSSTIFDAESESIYFKHREIVRGYQKTDFQDGTSSFSKEEGYCKQVHLYNGSLSSTVFLDGGFHNLGFQERLECSQVDNDQRLRTIDF